METNESTSPIGEEVIPSGLETKTVDAEPNSSGAPDIRALNERIGKASQFVDLLRMEMSKTIIG